MVQQGSTRRLRADGVTLDGATIAALAASLPNLTRLNVAGADLEDPGIAALLETYSDLVELKIGLAEPRDGHRFTSSRLTGKVQLVVGVAFGH